VHKHCPLKAAAPGGYDASCHWVKTDKAGKAAVSLPFFLLVLSTLCAAAFFLLPRAGVRDTRQDLTIVYVPSAQGPRAPPPAFSRYFYRFCAGRFLK